MANSQHAYQPDTSRQFIAETSTIELEHVSISQLLGRDYIFINVQNVQLPYNNPTLMYGLLDDLIEQLELTEAHTVAVTVDDSREGSPSFTRHDLAWHKHKICRIESIAITHQEQQEFMEMIWQCSTSAIPA